MKFSHTEIIPPPNSESESGQNLKIRIVFLETSAQNKIVMFSKKISKSKNRPQIWKVAVGIIIVLSFLIGLAKVLLQPTLNSILAKILPTRPISNQAGQGELTHYQNKPFRLSFDYSSQLFLTENKVGDSGWSINLYTQKPKSNFKAVVLDDFSWLDNRSFHISIKPLSQIKTNSNTYLDQPQEPQNWLIQGRSWQVFKLKNVELGTYKLYELLVLRSQNDFYRYEINIETLSPSETQLQILNSINLL
ncbi:MAG TPA: hypothetical protein DEP87_00355 [Candidatus Pacebacteria bacterium]|nr:hypothetical protein [Candidatus Paceibacterota bacterium]